jgi:hypothetical protein
MASNQMRVQAPDTAGPEALRPAPIIGDGFVQAARAPINTDLERMADALGSFNQSLTQFGSVAAAAYRKHQQETDMAAAQGLIAGKTNDEFMKDWRGGAIPNYAVPAPNLLVGKIAGHYQGDEIARNLSEQVNTGKIDLSKPDVDLPTMYTQQLAPILKQYQAAADAGDYQARGFISGLQEKALSYRQTLENQQTNVRQQLFVNQQAGAAQTAFQTAVTNSATPDQAVQSVRQLYQDIGPSLTVKAKNPMLDEQLVQLSKRLSSDPRYSDKIEALLATPRQDPQSGQDVPAIASTGASNPQRANDLLEISRNIQKARAGAWKDGRDQTMENAAFEAFRRQDGGAAFVQPRREQNPWLKDQPDGGWQTVGDEAQKNAAMRYFSWSQSDAAQNQRPQNIWLDREVRVAQAANVSVPHIKEALNTAVPANMNGNFVTDASQRQKVLDAYHIYSDLASNNLPWTEEKLGLNKPTAQFFKTMHVLTTSGMDTDSAMNLAANVIRNPDKTDTKGIEQYVQQNENAVARASVGNGGFWGTIFGGSPANSSEMVGRVKDVAGVLMKTGGYKAEDAVKMAQDYVAKTTTTVNGTAIPGVTFMKPADAKSLFNDKLDDLMPTVQKAHPELSKGDVSVRNMGDGRFMLIDKDHGMPISAANVGKDGHLVGGPIIFTQQELLSMQAAKQAAEQEKLDVEKQQNAGRILGAAGRTRDNLSDRADFQQWFERYSRTNAARHR